MLRFSIIPVLILVLAVNSCTSHPENNDLLDKVPSDTKLIRDLKDIYRAYRVYHTIDNLQEIIAIRLSDLQNPDTSRKEMFRSDTLGVAPEVYLNKDADSLVSICKKLLAVSFFDKELKTHTEKYISNVMERVKLLRQRGFQSKEFAGYSEWYDNENKQYITYVGKEFPMSRFTKLTESQFNEKIEKQNYVDKEEFGDYQAAIDKDLMEGFQKLEQLKKSSANFQEYSIYEIELADQFIINDSLIRANLYSGNLTTPLHIAVQKYHCILAKKQYSIYLFEAWLKWRTASQMETGLGKYDNIPNNEYDDMREQMVAVALDYTARYPQDNMAIDLVLILATYRIVSRFDDQKFENIEDWNSKGSFLTENSNYKQKQDVTFNRKI